MKGSAAAWLFAVLGLCLSRSHAWAPLAGRRGLGAGRAPAAALGLRNSLLLDGDADPRGGRVSFVALMQDKQAASAQTAVEVQASKSVSSGGGDGGGGGGGEGHLSIGQLLREYGLIALAFHFTVWCACLATVYTALSAGVQLPEMPEFLVGFLKGGEDGAAAAEAAAAAVEAAGAGDLAGAAVGGPAGAGVAGGMAMARLAATVGLVEVVGPLRLALTVAATPPLSKWARRFQAVRDAEAAVVRFAGYAQDALRRPGPPPA